jgi:hypothetical protein
LCGWGVVCGCCFGSIWSLFCGFDGVGQSLGVLQAGVVVGPNIPASFKLLLREMGGGGKCGENKWGGLC